MSHSKVSQKDVLILDSGIGGLSVAREIHLALPDVSTAYLADFSFFPYGEKSQPELNHRVTSIVSQCIKLFEPKVLVVACNTASTVVLPTLRKEFEVPVVGVVPAIHPAARLTKSGVIALLATKGTIEGNYIDGLVQSAGRELRLVKVASQRLVEIAEEKLRGIPPNPEELISICRPIFSSHLGVPDVVVLGCTHFPHLTNELLSSVSSQISWIDSGKAIANRVGVLLQSSNCHQLDNSHVFTGTTPVQDLPEKLKLSIETMGFDLLPWRCDEPIA
ncbi:MAG: glutamate racemase [Pseudobacteriovorax sp.]|nr:glutamate racemase [Pseudobacteriovorax sp.]